MKINPSCSTFIIFSGGGGLVTRSQMVEVQQGQTTFEITDVPASFDPNTTTVELLENVDDNVELVQIDVRRPDKRIVDSFIQREKTASDSIIQSSTDLRGANREKIIRICESAYYRRYEDMLGTIMISVKAKVPCKFKLQIKYFIEDTRIKWKPTIHVKINKDTHNAEIEGYIMVMNNSDFNFENVELQFAEFDLIREVGEEGLLGNIATEQAVQTKMPKTRLLQNLRRVKNIIK
ncbi:MAG: hypothetical protein GF329_01965 [Candidatus Lokiarchaeota archaeon]|nr:hypothetical protein [Candidatus Lokiarchaeota archaeon]